MRIRPLLFAAFVVAVFLAPVVVAGSAGVWATTGQQGAGPGGGNGEGNGPAGESGGGGEGTGGGAGGGDGAGRVVAAGDARGWMTLGEVAEANAIPLEEILAAFDLAPDTDPATALRDVESASFSVAELRAWLAERRAP